MDGLYSTVIGDNTVAGTLTGALAAAEAWLQVTVNGAALSPQELIGRARKAQRVQNAITSWDSRALYEAVFYREVAKQLDPRRGAGIIARMVEAAQTKPGSARVNEAPRPSRNPQIP